jgi:hypothetical protein
MLSIVNLVVLAVVYPFIRTAYQLYRNIQSAKASGIPYIVAPVLPFSRAWLIVHKIVFPLLQRLPDRFKHPWIHVIHPQWPWLEGFGLHWRPRREGGMVATAGPGHAETSVDTFLTVGPWGHFLISADPAVITQITTRRNDFPKPLWIYEGIAMYGPNVVTSEGKEWRRHRKVVAAPFGEKNNRLVWRESIFQAGEMIRHWREGRGSGKHQSPAAQSAASQQNGKSWSTLLGDVGHDAMRLSLYVISRAGFDIRCDWPGKDSTSDNDEGTFNATEVKNGHKMSYVDSLESLLSRLITLFIFNPSWIRKFLNLQCPRARAD